MRTVDPTHRTKRGLDEWGGGCRVVETEEDDKV